MLLQWQKELVLIKEVSKVMDKLKKEEKIYSPKRCYWQIKTVKKFQFLGFSLSGFSEG